MAAEISFRTDGSDFTESKVGEVMRVLREIESALLRGEESAEIFNSDGEVIGNWSITIPMR